MDIETIRHKGLKKYFLSGNAKGLVGNVQRIQLMLLSLENAQELSDLITTPPNFNLHPLTGEKSGYWSMTVTRNWRMTFYVSEDDRIYELNLEDYHGT